MTKKPTYEELEKRIQELEQGELARKKADTELAQNKALLDATGRMARVGGWELDAETLEVTWTEETYRIHEIPLYQKPPLQEAIRFFHPEDRPKLERAIQRALDHAEPYDMEIRFITAKGNHLWTRTKCLPEIVDGKIVKLKGMFQDITPRKRAEEKYKESDIKLQEAVKAGNIGLWDWDLVTNKVFYSAEWKSQIGYAEDEITDHFDEWRTRVHPDDLDRTLEKVQKSIDEASKDHIVEFRFQHKDGSYRWIMAHSSIVIDENGKPIRMVGSHTDITEQKKTEVQLRQSENKLRSVLDATPFPIAVVGREDDEIFFWSRSAVDLFGYTASTISEWYEIAYPDSDYRADVIEKWKAFLEIPSEVGRPINTGEYKIACKDGSERICELYATFLPDSLIVTFNDITDRKRAENSLLKSEMQFRQVFEHIGIGIAIYNVVDNGNDFIFVDINPAGTQMGEKSRAEHIGKSVLDVYPGVKDFGLFEVFQGVWRSGIPKQHPTSKYKDDKVSFWVNNYVSRLPSGEVMAVYEDVTSKKQAEHTLRNSEAKLRSTLNATPFPIAMVDLDDEAIEFWSQTAHDLFGHTAPTASQWYEMAYPDPDYRQKVIERWKPVLEIARQSNKPVNAGEYRITCKDGSERVCLLYATFLPNNLVVTFNDITERKRAENELAEYRDHLEDLVEKRTLALEAKNKELETFTYSVSHDLKAPLRGIDGYSRLLSEEYADKLDDEGLTFLSNVRNSAAHMNQLIEDLLAYSRMERRNIHSVPVDLKSLVELIVSERKHDIESKNTELMLSLPFDVIHADMDTVRQVLGNYLDNAIKFSREQDRPHVEIGGSENNHAWTLWVKDNGIGFDPRYHDRIFTIFQRLHRMEDYPGTGVGLAIVHKAVERIGGRVWAESCLGEGATFFVEIPKIDRNAKEKMKNESA